MICWSCIAATVISRLRWRRCSDVLATEVSKSSVRAADYNLDANGVDNVTMVRMSSDEISAAFARVREFRRMKDVDLDSYRFTTLFVDPPRCGLDAATLALASGFENILYVSCNPQTLQENVAALSGTHRIGAAAVFDQFLIPIISSAGCCCSAAESVRPGHPEQLFGAYREVVGSASAAQDVSCGGSVVDASGQQPLGDMHRDHFAQHQPGRDLDTVEAAELDDLVDRHSNATGLSATRGGATRRESAGVSRASSNSSTCGAAAAQLRFIAPASSRVARFHTNSPVCSILRSVSLRPMLAKPMIGGL